MLYSDLIKIHRDMDEKKLIGKEIDGIQYNLLPYGWKYQKISVIATITKDGKLISCALYGIGKHSKRKKSDKGGDNQSQSGDDMLKKSVKMAIPYWIESAIRTSKMVSYPVSDKMTYLSSTLSEKHYNLYISELEKLLGLLPKSTYLKAIFLYLSNRKNDIFTEFRKIVKEKNISVPQKTLKDAFVYFEVLNDGDGDGTPLTFDHDIDEDGNAFDFVKAFTDLFVQKECLGSKNREKIMEKFPKLDSMTKSLIGKPSDDNLNEVEVCGYTQYMEDLTRNLNLTVKEGLHLIQTLSWLRNNFTVAGYKENDITKSFICWTDAEIENILQNKADKSESESESESESDASEALDENAGTKENTRGFDFNFKININLDLDLSGLGKAFDSKSDDDPPIDISEMSKIIRAFRGKKVDGDLKGNTHILIIGERKQGRAYIEYYNILSNTRMANNIKRWISCMQGIRLFEKSKIDRMTLQNLTWSLLPFTKSEANKNKKLMDRFFSLRRRLLLCMLENRPLPQEVFKLGEAKVRKLILGGKHWYAINYTLSFLFFLNKFDAVQRKDKKKMDALRRLENEIQTGEAKTMEDVNNIHDRDFLWGRIYALVSAIEETTMPESSVGRLTHADKRWDAFRRNPRATYDSLYGKIIPYIKKLQKRRALGRDDYPFISVLNKVNTMFETLEDATSTKPVGNAFLSGFYVQREKISAWEYVNNPHLLR